MHCYHLWYDIWVYDFIILNLILSIYYDNRLHNSIQTSQYICFDPLYLLSQEQPTFLPTKKTKQLTPFVVLSRGAQPSILAGRRPECPAFQQPMKPATSSLFLNRQLGPCQVQEPKGYEPCGYPSTTPQRLSSVPQPHKLPMALTKLSSLKQWSLPQHLIGPCGADSWPLPVDISHHPDSYPTTALSKKKTTKNFLYQCGTEKTKKSTKYGPLHRQDVEDC